MIQVSIYDIIAVALLVGGLVPIACGTRARQLLRRARRVLQRSILTPDRAERRRLALEAEGLIDSAERWLPTMWPRLIRRRVAERARPPR